MSSDSGIWEALVLLVVLLDELTDVDLALLVADAVEEEDMEEEDMEEEDMEELDVELDVGPELEIELWPTIEEVALPVEVFRGASVTKATVPIAMIMTTARTIKAVPIAILSRLKPIR
jgi:hypothetical protein